MIEPNKCYIIRISDYEIQMFEVIQIAKPWILCNHYIKLRIGALFKMEYQQKHWIIMLENKVEPISKDEFYKYVKLCQMTKGAFNGLLTKI